MCFPETGEGKCSGKVPDAGPGKFSETGLRKSREGLSEIRRWKIQERALRNQVPEVSKNVQKEAGYGSDSRISR